MNDELNRSFAFANGPVTAIRKIPVTALLEYLIKETMEILKREKAPGVIVGISGTDSILSYIVCLEACKRLGLPLKNVRGVNFQHEMHDADQGENQYFKCIPVEDPKWIERDIFPFLQKRYPEARLEIDKSIKKSADGARWGAIHDKAKEEVNGRGDMLSGTYYFPVGTRNATEDAIYGFTLITKGVSFFPIIKIYKTEVIDLCRYLGVPEIAIEKSRDIDCDCGRFEVQAYMMDELDTYIMARRGLIDKSRIDTLDKQKLIDVRAFYTEETIEGGFKDDKVTPHMPEDFAPAMV